MCNSNQDYNFLIDKMYRLKKESSEQIKELQKDIQEMRNYMNKHIHDDNWDRGNKYEN